MLEKNLSVSGNGSVAINCLVELLIGFVVVCKIGIAFILSAVGVNFLFVKLVDCKCFKQRLDNALISFKTTNLDLFIDREIAACKQELEDSFDRFNDVPDKVYELVAVGDTPCFMDANFLEMLCGIVNHNCGSAFARFSVYFAVSIFPEEIAFSILILLLSIGSRKQNCALSIGINYTANLAVVKNKNILAVKVISS